MESHKTILVNFLFFVLNLKFYDAELNQNLSQHEVWFVSTWLLKLYTRLPNSTLWSKWMTNTRGKLTVAVGAALERHQ